MLLALSVLLLILWSLLLLPWLLPLLKDFGGNLFLLGEVGRGKPVEFHEEFPHAPLDDPEAEDEDEHARP